MRRLLAAQLFPVLVHLAAAQSAAQDRASPVAWVENLETAHALSAEDGKPVIAYFTFDT